MNTPLRATLAPLTLDQLTQARPSTLAQWYSEAELPRLPDLDGAPPGRMLAVVGPLGRGPARRAVARLAASRGFPWRGKTWQSSSSEHGSGINRVRLPAKPRPLYPFETRIAPSVIDGQPCVVLDYNLPSNPWFIRPIHDELRQVAPSLYLGPALLTHRTGHSLVLWFAIAP